MNKQVLIKGYKLVGLFLGIAIALWFLNLDLQRTMMKLTLERQANASENVSVFFVGNDNPGLLKRGRIESTGQKEVIYIPIPNHVDVDRAVIRIEGSASDWKVHQVGIRSRFFLFDLFAYEWPLRKIESAAPQSDVEPAVQNGALTFANSKDPLALRFPINEGSLAQSNDLLLAKLFYIALIWLLIYWVFFSNFIWSLLSTRAKDYQAFEASALASRERNKLLIPLSALLFIAVILILRFPLIAEPGILIEDAMEMSDVLSGAAHPLNPESYFYYRGYYVFLTEVVAHFSSLFPFSWQPAMYLWIGLALACIAFCTFTYSGLFKSRIILLVAPIVFCLGSFSGPLMYLTITSILFTSTVLLMAITVRPVPFNHWQFLVYGLLIVILAWSGPYTPQLLPLSLALILLHASGRKTIVLALMVVLAFLYTASAASGMVQFDNILDSSVRVALFDALIKHIFLMELYPDASYKTGLAIIAAIIFSQFVFRKDRSYLKHSLAFLGASLASLATYYISFKYHIYRGVLLDSHTVIAQFCWLVFIMLTIDKLLSLINNKHLKVPASIGVCIALVVFLYGKTIKQKDDYVLVVHKDVPLFMEAIKQAQNVELQAGEFLQLWHINQFKQVTSIYLGDTGDSAKSVELSQLPKDVQAFAIPFSLDRELNNIVYYDPRTNTISYSHTGRTKQLPKWQQP